MPKHELLLAGAHEMSGAAAAGLAFDFVPLFPVRGVEPGGGCVAGPGRVI